MWHQIKLKDKNLPIEEAEKLTLLIFGPYAFC